MKTFREQFEELREQFEELEEQAINKLRDLIKSKGKESLHNNKRCLKITKDDYPFLTEINAETLVGYKGREYNFYVLDTEDFLSLIDYLMAEYK